MFSVRDQNISMAVCLASSSRCSPRSYTSVSNSVVSAQRELRFTTQHNTTYNNAIYVNLTQHRIQQHNTI